MGFDVLDETVDSLLELNLESLINYCEEYIELYEEIFKPDIIFMFSLYMLNHNVPSGTLIHHNCLKKAISTFLPETKDPLAGGIVNKFAKHIPYTNEPQLQSHYTLPTHDALFTAYESLKESRKPRSPKSITSRRPQISPDNKLDIELEKLLSKGLPVNYPQIKYELEGKLSRATYENLHLYLNNIGPEIKKESVMLNIIGSNSVVQVSFYYMQEPPIDLSIYINILHSIATYNKEGFSPIALNLDNELLDKIIPLMIESDLIEQSGQLYKPTEKLLWGYDYDFVRPFSTIVADNKAPRYTPEKPLNLNQRISGRNVK